MATTLASQTPALQPQAHPSPVSAIGFHGQGGTLFGIQIVNLFLIIITLGIYSFWSRVRVRRYMLSQTEFEGDRFAYHGTGRELFNGWLKAMLIFALPLTVLGVLQAWADMESGFYALLQILAYMIAVFFIPIATVNARRYRLSRCSWRGIRFSFRGGVRDFVNIYVKGWLLTLITFGLYYPIWQNRRQSFLLGDSYFGNQRLAFDGRGKDIFLGFVLHLLLTLPTLGLCWVWYGARVQRYFAAHTLFQAARFRSSATGGGILGLWLVNALLFVFTLGLAWSWITVRNARYYLGHLAVVGDFDVTNVTQEAQSATATGEGLSGFLDLNFDLG